MEIKNVPNQKRNQKQFIVHCSLQFICFKYRLYFLFSCKWNQITLLHMAALFALETSKNTTAEDKADNFSLDWPLYIVLLKNTM